MEFTDYTRECLKKAGWSHSRSVDIKPLIMALETNGYEAPDEIKKFLIEYGYLNVVHRHYSRSGTDSFQIDPKTAVADIFRDRIISYSNRVGSTLFPVGEAYTRHMTLCVSADMKFYAGYDDYLVFLGSGVAIAFNTLCEGLPLQAID